MRFLVVAILSCSWFVEQAEAFLFQRRWSIYSYNQNQNQLRIKIKASSKDESNEDIVIFEEEAFQEITGKGLSKSRSDKVMMATPLTKVRSMKLRDTVFEDDNEDTDYDDTETVDRFRFKIDSNSIQRTISTTKSIPESVLRSREYDPSQVFSVDWYDEPKIIKEPSTGPFNRDTALQCILNYSLIPSTDSIFDQSRCDTINEESSDCHELFQRNHPKRQVKYLWGKEIKSITKNYLLSFFYFTRLAVVGSILYYSGFYLWKRVVAPVLNQFGLLLTYSLIFTMQLAAKIFVQSKRFASSMKLM